MGGIEACFREGVGHRRDELVPDQLASRDVHPHGEGLVVGSRQLPAPRVAARLVQNPLPDRDDQTGLLGERDEVGRRQEAAVRVLPAHEGLHAHDRAGFHRDLGLEVDPELLTLDRLPECVLGVETIERSLSGDVVEQHQAPAAGLLRAVHRGVGVTNQILGVLLGIDRERDPDAGTGDHVAVREVEWKTERLEEPLSDRDGILLVAEVLAEHRELIAAEAGDRLLAAQRVLEALRDGEDELVARGMPQAVVDHLEAVEVEEKHGHVAPGTALETVDGSAEPVQKQQPAGKPRQGITQELVLVGAPGNDVRDARGEDEGAVDHRPAPRVRDGVGVVVDARRARAPRRVRDGARRSQSPRGTGPMPGRGSARQPSRRSGSGPR